MQILNNPGLNWARDVFFGVGTTLPICVILTTGISVNPASAADSLVSETHNRDLSSNQTSQEYSDIAAVVVKQDTVTSVKSETIREQKQPQLIAQTDSSGVVGDTLADMNKLRQQLLIEPIVKPGESTGILPGSSAGSPTAYGASWGQAFIGGGINIPFSPIKSDGSLTLGFGVGDAVKSIGMEVDLDIISTGVYHFAGSGTAGFKLHKYFADGTAIAFGWTNPIKWGDAGKRTDSIYGVVTKSFDLQPDNPNNKLPLTVSLGFGSASFHSETEIQNGSNSVNVFGSLGLRIIPQASLVSSWTGNSLNMGASFAPFNKIPIVINTIFTNVTSNSNQDPGFTISAGYIFQF